MRRLFICLIILVFWGFTSAAKADPLAVARAWIDWSSLEIYTDEGVSVSWDEYYENWSVGAYANENEESSSSSDWNSSKNVSVTNRGASASASITTSVEVFAETQGIGGNMAKADAWQKRSFWVSGTGSVEFVIPYHLEASIKDANNDWANAYIDVSLKTPDCSGEWCPSVRKETPLYLDKHGYNENGFLRLSYYYYNSSNDPYQVGYLEAHLYSYAESWSSPVPLPSALLLFGSGLFGVAGFRKFFGSGRKRS